MSNADIRGRFVWHELMTTDTNAAAAFYTKLVPWKTEPSGMPGYTLWMSGGNRAAGLMSLPDGEAPGTPPQWLIYVGSPDVDATVEAAQKLGGRVLKPASDIPSVGRFAVLADPQGAAFAVFKPAPGSGEGVPAGGAVGDFTWHELATTDPEAALQFYTELFGWGKGAAHDMGPMGTYQLVSHGGQDVGGIYKTRDTSAPPNWLSYVRVSNAGKAASAVKAGGGRILNGPMEVPGGSWIVMLHDPQGGAFAVVEAPRAAASKPAQTPAAKAPPKPKPAAAKPAATKPQPAAKSAAKKAARRKSPARKAAAKTRSAAKRGKRVAAKKVARKTAARRKGTARSAKKATRRVSARAKRKSGKRR